MAFSGYDSWKTLLSTRNRSVPRHRKNIAAHTLPRARPSPIAHTPHTQQHQIHQIIIILNVSLFCTSSVKLHQVLWGGLSQSWSQPNSILIQPNSTHSLRLGMNPIPAPFIQNSTHSTRTRNPEGCSRTCQHVHTQPGRAQQRHSTRTCNPEGRSRTCL